MTTRRNFALLVVLAIGSILIPATTYASMCFPPAAILTAYVTVPALSLITLIALAATIPFTVVKQAELLPLSKSNKIGMSTILVLGSTSILFGSLSLANSANVMGEDINKTVFYFFLAIIGYIIGTIFFVRSIFNYSKFGKTRIKIASTIILSPILVTIGLLIVFYLIGTTYAQTVTIPKNSELFGCIIVPDDMWITEGIKGLLAIILTIILSLLGRKISKKMIVSSLV